MSANRFRVPGPINAPGPVNVPVRMGNQPDPNNRAGLPGQRPRQETAPVSKPRDVTCVLPFFLNMQIPFTSQAGENIPTATKGENFDLNVRGAWTDLVDVRARLGSTQNGSQWSTQQVPLLSIAGASDLVHPMLYWRKPFTLGANHIIQGDFTNDGGEAAGNLSFYAERTENEVIVSVKRSETYWLLINLGLSGGATGVGTPQSAALEYPLLVYGLLSTAEAFDVRLMDTSNNYAWSSDQLPIGAFAGLRASGIVQPIMYYPKPYYLRPNATIRAEWTNSGAETGGYLAFICEKVLG